MKRLLTKIQEKCKHCWTEWERDGWAHDARHCTECKKVEIKKVANSGYGL